MAPHSSTPSWKIPWMEEPGRLQSMDGISPAARKAGGPRPAPSRETGGRRGPPTYSMNKSESLTSEYIIQF